MEQIRTLTVNECLAKLREHGLSITAEVLQLGMQQGVFPFGVVVQGPGQRRPYIFEKQVEAWIAERVG